MKKTKILTVLGVLLAMGITACGGGAKESEKPADTSSAAPASSESSKQSSQSSQGSQGSQSSQSSQGSQSSQDSSSSSAHTHSFGEWAPDATPVATCTDPGSESRSCECGEKESRDTPKLDHVLSEDGAVVKINSDNKKVTQKTCTRGGENVLVMPLANNSGIFKSVAGTEKETWTIGDASTFQPKEGVYKMDKGDVLVFKVNVATAVQGAEIEIGAKYTNPSVRYFYNQKDGGQYGDNPDSDAFRYYTRINNGEFVGIDYTGLMSGIFGDGTEIRYMPLGKFDLQAGENTIYIRQSNLGYRVSLEGEFRVAIGNAQIGGEDPSHEHVYSTEWSKDANTHWKVCTADNCDDPAGTKYQEAAHDKLGTPEHADEPASCTEAGKDYWKCSVCGYESFDVIEALGHDFTGQTPEVTETATCEKAGSKTTHCVRCDQDIVEVIPALDHDWDAGEPIAKDGDNVAYTKFACQRTGCNKQKIEIAAMDGTMASGSSNKAKTPDGYLKLGSNGNSISYKYNFNKDGYVANGKMYQYGFMDNWSGTNKSCTYRSGSNTDNPFNFEVTVAYANGSNMKIDLTPYADTEYQEMLETNPNGRTFEGFTNDQGQLVQCSEDGLCPIGDFTFLPGVNTITFKRCRSYNLSVLKFVFVFEEIQHTHQLASEWSYDETGHWHACTAPGCPNPKQDFEAHTLVEDTTAGTAATCTEAGVKVETCTCGYSKTSDVDALGHHMVKDTENCVAPTCAADGVYAEKCDRTDCTETQTQPHVKDVGVYNTKAKSVAADSETGAVAYDIYNCEAEGHSHAAYVWNALDYDAALTSARSSNAPKTASDNVQFGDGKVQYQDKDVNNKGTHLVYKVYIPEGVTSSILSVLSTNRAKDTNGIFSFNPSDQSPGWELVGEEFKQPTHRYGLVVNGQRVQLGYDDYPTDKNDKTNYAWFSFPARIQLVPGEVNEIELFNMGGYRLQMKSFRLSGMPQYVSTHTHEPASVWSYDENQHWHACVGADCDDPTVKLDAANHVWDDGTVTTPATVDAAGVMTYTCACGATKTEVIPQLPLNVWSLDEIKANRTNSGWDADKDWGDGVKGFKFNKANGGFTITYTADSAQTVKLQLMIAVKYSNRGSTGFWKQGSSDKTSVTLGTVDPVALSGSEPNFANVKESTVDDGGKLSVPEWFDICNVNLVEGENTITVTFLTGGYSYYICGARLMK